MNVNKSTNNNKRKLDNEEFSWSHDKIQLLLKVTLGYKFTCEFGGTSWDSKRRMYKNISEQLVEFYPHGEDSYQNRSKLNKNLVGAKLKAIGANYRKTADASKRSGGGRIVLIFFILCEKF